MKRETVPLIKVAAINHSSGMYIKAIKMSRKTWSLRATWPPILLGVLAAGIGYLAPYAWLSVMAILGVVLMMFDTVARQRQFIDMRIALRRAGGLSGNALARFRKARSSWCTRRAAISAAVAEGFDQESSQLIKEWGYKPWHVFPDDTFSIRSPFLKSAFWKSVLGISQSR